MMVDHNCDDFASPTTSGSKPGKLTYLVTYSQADLLKCNSREQFAHLICAEFNRKDEVVTQWACCVENHTKKGVHYHLALKLSKKRRFELVCNSIYEKQGISVHFQQWATFYYDAFTYVTKHDQYYVTSHGHPPLSNSPLTRRAVQGKRRASTNSSPATPDCQGRNTTENKGKKRLRLQSNSLYQLVVANNIKSDLELCALSKVQYDEGKRDLNRYVMSTAESKRIEMLKTTWKIETSKETLERAKKYD